MTVFLLRPTGAKSWGWFLPMLRTLRVLALGYDCRALRALAAPRPTLNDPLGKQSVSKMTDSDGQRPIQAPKVTDSDGQRPIQKKNVR